MLKGRGLLIIVLMLAILAAYWLLTRSGASFGLFRSKAEDLPIDLREVIPADWEVVLGQQNQCDFDGDGEREWLVFYRYDHTSVSAPYRAEGATISRGPIGAAIFDRQTNVIPEGQGNPSPYRPTMLVPYRLLPDFYAGKGQGYLSETGTTIVETIFYPPASSGEDCQVNEISILGYSDSQLPTRLSIFRWQNPETGFRAEHFIGNARVEASIPTDSAHPIQKVITYNRLENHRSLLCESRTYNRSGEDGTLLFTEDSTAFTINFCYNAPSDPTYPEGVVIALLRGSQPTSRRGVALTPPTDGFLINKPAMAFDVHSKAAQGIQIFSVTNRAGVNTDPSGGHRCTADEVQTSEQPWICGRERTMIETEIMLDGEVRQAIWQLISVVPDQIDSDVHWRIESVDLP